MPTSHTSAIDHYQIGLKLRSLRMGKQLTLARLASETGLSTALLSKLEVSLMIPTLPTLAKICRAYGVSLSYFFSDPTRHSVSITRKAHLAVRGSQQAVRRTPLHFDHIGSTRCGASMLEIPSGVLVPASEPGQGISCLVFIVEGRLHLNIAGEKDVLDAGDCACIDTDMIVTWASATKEACRALLVRV